MVQTPSALPIAPQPTIFLQGAPIDRAQQTVDTASHTISFSCKVGEQFLPTFTANRRVVRDETALPPFTLLKKDELTGDNLVETFSKLLNDELVKNRDFLQPDPANTASPFLYTQLVHSRIERYLDQVTAFIADLDCCESVKTECYKVLNQTHVSLNKTIVPSVTATDFEPSLFNTTHAAFINVFEKMLEAIAPSSMQHKILQAVIDRFYTDHFKREQEVDQANIEVSLQVRAIDPESRMVVSITPESQGSSSPQYCIYQIPQDAKSRNKGDFVYRGEDNRYYFQDTNLPVKESKIPFLVKQPVERIVLRPLLPNETPRAQFRYDRARFKTSDLGTIWSNQTDSSHIAAMVSSFGINMQEAGELLVYNSETNQTHTFTPELQKRALVALLKFGSTYVKVTNNEPSDEIVRLGNISAVKQNFDPTAVKLVFAKQDKSLMEYPIELLGLSMPFPYIAKGVLPHATFSSQVDTDQVSRFISNPAVALISDKQEHYLRDAPLRRFVYRMKGVTLNDKGMAVDDIVDVDYNPTNKTPLPLESKVDSSTTGHITYADIEAGTLVQVPYRLVPIGNGTFQKANGTPVVLGKIGGFLLSSKRESEGPLSARFEYLEKALLTGEKVYIKIAGKGGYEGEITQIRFEKKAQTEDGLFETLQVNIIGTFGEKSLGLVIHQKDNSQKRIASCDLMCDFTLYSEATTQVAPLLEQDGSQLINTGMVSSMLIPMGENAAAPIGIIQMLADIVYAGLHNPTPKQPRWMICHQGETRLYTDRAQFELDRALLSQQQRRSAAANKTRESKLGCGCF